MSNLVGEIESEIDGARDLKQAAADAYEVAEKYQDTEAQKAFEEEARTAYFAAKEHLVAIEGLRDDAVDMKDKSDAKRDEATNEAEEASKVNFDSIFEEINTLIEDASNGGGDGTELENWLADFDVTDAFSNPCSAKSVMVEDKILGDGMKAFAFASNCPSRYLYVQM
jgi:lysyl-tRNA synthetase class I